MQERAWEAAGVGIPWEGAGSPTLVRVARSESLPGAAALAPLHSQARGPERLFLDLPFSFTDFFFLCFRSALPWKAWGGRKTLIPGAGSCVGGLRSVPAQGSAREAMGNSEEQQGEPLALHGDSHRDTHPCPGTAIPTAASAATDEARGRVGQHRGGSRAGAGQAQGEGSSHGERLPSMEISSCTAGTEETPSAPQTLPRGNKNTQEKLRAASRTPQHQGPLQARTCPCPNRGGKIHLLVRSCIPQQPASFQPGN